MKTFLLTVLLFGLAFVVWGQASAPLPEGNSRVASEVLGADAPDWAQNFLDLLTQKIDYGHERAVAAGEDPAGWIYDGCPLCQSREQTSVLPIRRPLTDSRSDSAPSQ